MSQHSQQQPMVDDTADFQSTAQTRQTCVRPGPSGDGEILKISDQVGTPGELILDADAGYLRLDTLVADSVHMLDSVNVALDSLGGTSGLVLDLRMNGGGYDYLANEIAGLFTDTSYHAYTKYSTATRRQPASRSSSSRTPQCHISGPS